MKKYSVIPIISILIAFPVLIFSSVASNMNRDLILAVSKGKLKTVQALVEKGANVNCRYDKGKTPLHWAALSGELKIAVYLVSKGANVNALDDNGATPLHLASINHNLDLVKLLVIKGADVNAADRHGWTPLHYFTFYENPLIVKYLIIQQAELTNVTTRQYMDIPTNYTALDIAVKKNYSNIIKVLQNPGKYLSYSKMPYLEMTGSIFSGPDSRLIAPQKTTMQLQLENKGGMTASNVEVSIEKISNCGGINVGVPYSSYVYAGQRIEWNLPFEATRSAEGGKALFKVTAKEPYFGRESNPLFLSISVLPPQPPQLFLSGISNLNQNLLLKSPDPLAINLKLENKGLGAGETVLIYAVPVSHCEDITFRQISNLTIGTNQTKEFGFMIEPSEWLKDGLSRFQIIAEDLLMSNASTNTYEIQTRHLPRPSWVILGQFRQLISERIDSNILSTGNGESNYSGFITNFQTNLAPLILLSNTGEAPSRNLNVTLELKNEMISNISNPNQQTRWNFILPEIQTNEQKSIQLPVAFPHSGAHEMITIQINGADEMKRSIINTNIILWVPND